MRWRHGLSALGSVVASKHWITAKHPEPAFIRALMCSPSTYVTHVLFCASVGEQTHSWSCMTKDGGYTSHSRQYRRQTAFTLEWKQNCIHTIPYVSMQGIVVFFKLPLKKYQSSSSLLSKSTCTLCYVISFLKLGLKQCKQLMGRAKVTLTIKPLPFWYILLSVLSLWTKWTVTLQKRCMEEPAKLLC